MHMTVMTVRKRQLLKIKVNENCTKHVYINTHTKKNDYARIYFYFALNNMML